MNANPPARPPSAPAGASIATEAATLSEREWQVFRLLGHGLGTQAIAAELHVSVKTVETHRGRIMAKLRLANALALQHLAELLQRADPIWEMGGNHGVSARTEF